MLNIGRCLTLLEGFYGPYPTPPQDPFVFLVWTVLSHKTTLRKAERSLAALKRLPALTPDAVYCAPKAKLEAAVRLAGPSLDARLDALHLATSLFRRRPALATVLRGRLPAARRALKPFPLLGDDGARRFLLFTTDHVVMPVDGSVRRVATRLGLGCGQRSVPSIRRAIASALPKTSPAFRRAFLYLSHHGAATCTESDPHCLVCPLRTHCPEAQTSR